MAILLGVDTGGSYTDAVLCNEATGRLIGSAKSPTTHHDLSLGVGAAIDAVLEAGDVEAGDIDLVSLSTTLATNALVEGKGRPAGLVMIGFEDGALDRGGLREALADTHVVMGAGGHGSHGEELAPLDLDALAPAIDELASAVDALAITGHFSVRNPSHELAVRDLARSRTGLPVTCSHELSSSLNGPKRALTALLNARLIALIDDLVNAAGAMTAQRGIAAPLMIVRGNGSLVSADFVRERPIETILSGPAASLIGAGHLTDETDAFIADIGGTTTDIAVLIDGRPELSPDGAMVGRHETMVEAIRLHTHGIGGDSEVSLADRAVGPQLEIGPRRIVPLAMAAATSRDAVFAMLRRQLAASVPGPHDGILVTPTAHTPAGRAFGRAEAAVLEALGGDPRPLDEVIRSRVHEQAVRRLVLAGVVQLAGFTPTDACHVLELQTDLDVQAAEGVATLFARRRDRFGEPIATDAAEISQAVVHAVCRRSAEALLAAGLDRDGIRTDVGDSPLVAASLDGTAISTRVDIGAALTIVGLGAPAPTYYPRIAALLGTSVRVPAGVEVANAIGAAVAPVQARRSVTVTAPRRGIYRVHLGDPPTTVHDKDRAQELATATARSEAEHEARASGGRELSFDLEWDEVTVEVDGRPLFVEGTARVTCTGRPTLR